MGWALTYEFEDVTALEIELMSLMRTHSPFRLAIVPRAKQGTSLAR